MNPVQRREKLLHDHPGYVTAADVGRMLGIHPTGVRHHKHHISHKEVDGVTLYNKLSASHYASKFTKANKISRMAVHGGDVERLEKICETFYRTQLDVAPKEVLALAKRLAKL